MLAASSPSTWTWTGFSSASAPIIFHEESGASRTTMATPGVPAQACKIGICETQDLQTSAS
jgi:hypothetical protein